MSREGFHRFLVEIRIVLLILVSALMTFPTNVSAKKNADVYMTVKDVSNIPISFHNGNYYYHSTNEKVMKFSETGKMMAKKKGNCTVVLTYFDSNNKPVRTKFKVKVHDKVKRFKWKKKVSKLGQGQQYQFAVKYKVASKKNVVFEWKSSKKSVATVDKNGMVTAHKKGTTTIKCSVKGQKKAVVSVKLRVVFIPITSVSLPKGSMKLKVGQSYNINADVDIKPANASNMILDTTSADESVVKIVNGIMYGLKKGTTTVTIKAADGSKKKTKIKVYVDDWLTGKETTFIAHRGLSAEAPENTLTAFKLAADRGFYATESDVYVTKDGKFVVSHDGNLLRMCGVNKDISDLTLAEIKKCPIISGSNYNLYKDDNNAKYMPTLSEYLNVCKNNNIVPMIEIKFIEESTTFDNNNALYRLYQEVKQVMGNKPCYIISFYESNIVNLNEIKLKSKDKGVRLCLLVWFNRTINDISIYKYCLNNNIGFSVGNTGNESLTRKIKADKGLVGVWTVNDCAEAKKYIKLGVDFVVSDCVLWYE